MMPAAKHFDPVIGVDIHIIMIPTPAGPVPTPLPNPFVGMVIDPMDYPPIIGATVKISGICRAQAGTACKNIPPHLPLGGPFQKPPGNEGEIFMGSATVLADGEPFSFMAVPVLSCQDIGMPAPPRKKKKSKSMVLPTTVLMAIPGTVTVGGPPTISLMGMAMKGAFAALGPLGKGIRKLQRGSGKIGKFFRKVSKKIHKMADKAMDKLKVSKKMRKKVHDGICSVTGHPVDVATGKVMTDNIDFELPGPIPLVWERKYYSISTYEGPLGHGWHHKYDIALCEDKTGIAVRWEEGRSVIFPRLKKGQKYFNQLEKLTLIRDQHGYSVRTKDLLFYRFGPFLGFEQNHPLLKIENASGLGIGFSYDLNQRLTAITDSGGRHLQVVNDDKGRITAIFGPHPDQQGKFIQLIRYKYNANGDLSQAFDALGHPWTFVYDNHKLAKETNRNGLSFYFEYENRSQNARCIHTWGDGGIYDHKLTYNDTKQKTEVVNSLGHKTTYFWNDKGVVTKVTNPLGHSTETVYDEFNNVVKEVDELGNATEYEFDARGNCTKVIKPDGAVVEMQYQNTLLTEATDEIGGKWKWEYNSQGQLIKRTNPLGHETQFVYQTGLLSQLIDTGGNVSKFHYDNHKNITAVTAPNSTRSQWRFDLLGRCRTMINPKGAVQKFIFNHLSQVTQSLNADGEQRHLKYDGEGNLIEWRNQHNTIKFVYQGMNRLISRTENNTIVKFKYDKEEQLVDITNENGRVYNFDLDPTGEVVKESGFDDLMRSYSRDPAGQAVKVERPGGKFVYYVYDSAGRVIEMAHASGAKETYKYRLDGELIAAENDALEISFERDPMGRIIKEYQGEHWVESAYDVLGMRTEVRSSLGHYQRITRNAMGDVASVKYGSLDQYQVDFNRDELGLELERTLPGGVKNRWKRDKLGRPLQQSISQGERFIKIRDYRWDINERLKEISDPKQGSTVFTYDSTGTLTSATYSDGTVETRLPDAIGNLFKDTSKKGRKYGPAGQLLKSYGPLGATKYSYDAEGNLIRKEEPGNKVWEYQWNDAGMMTKVIRPDGMAVSFVYDPLGRRIAKNYNGKSTFWVWDGNNPLHEWTVSAPSVSSEPGLAPSPFDFEAIAADKREAELHPSQISTIPPPYANEEALANAITWIFEPGTFCPMAKVQGGQSYSILTDHLGTPNTMLDSSGNTVWSADISIYGKLRNLKGEKQACPFRWPGQYEDEETGLYYNGFRFYDPTSGQYISQDPIKLFGHNPTFYSYVHNPNAWIDTLGLDPLGTGGYSVYALYEKGASEPYYIGITKQNVSDRMSQHMDTGRYGDNTTHKVLQEDITVERARGYEQAYIEKYNTKTGTIGKDIGPDNRGNKINSFDKTRTDARGKAFKSEYDDIIKKGC